MRAEQVLKMALAAIIVIAFAGVVHGLQGCGGDNTVAVCDCIPIPDVPKGGTDVPKVGTDGGIVPPFIPDGGSSSAPGEDDNSNDSGSGDTDGPDESPSDVRCGKCENSQKNRNPNRTYPQPNCCKKGFVPRCVK